MMIWHDVRLSEGDYLPKPIYYLTSSVCLIMAFLAVDNAITHFNMNKIIGLIGSIFLFHCGICNVLMILKGDEYIKSIEKVGKDFLVTNIYNKKRNFTVHDVRLVTVAKFSITHLFLSRFYKKNQGLDLYLNDGHKYYITYEMEHIDNLKEHLQGKGGKDLER